MKKFIQNTTLFILTFLILLGGIIIFNFVLVNTTKINIPINKKVLILGDSNSQCALNDSIYNSAINLSKSSDSYFYSYLKLKKITKYTKIDTLILSFSPHNIFRNGWLLDDAHIYSRLRIYYPFMEINDFILIIKNNPLATLKAIFAIPSQTINNIISKILNKSFSYGGFRLLNRDILSEVQEKLKNGEKIPFFNIPKTHRISNNEIQYLNKIIYLCNKQNIKLILVNMPKRKELLNYPKYGVKEFNDFYDKNYFNIEYLDFSELKMPDNFYGDFVHLNIRGSTYFSNLLKKVGLENLRKKYERTTTAIPNVKYRAKYKHCSNK